LIGISNIYGIIDEISEIFHLCCYISKIDSKFRYKLQKDSISNRLMMKEKILNYKKSMLKFSNNLAIIPRRIKNLNSYHHTIEYEKINVN
jgi:hypothetical protein